MFIDKATGRSAMSGKKKFKPKLFKKGNKKKPFNKMDGKEEFPPMKAKEFTKRKRAY